MSTDYNNNNTSKSNPTYTDEQLLKYIKMYGGKDYVPAKNDFEGDPDVPAPSTIMARFGTWNNALQEAGYETNQESPEPANKKDKQTAIEQIRMVGGEDHRPTHREFNQHDDTMAASTVKAKFGSWNSALIAAGYQPRQPGSSGYSTRDKLKPLYKFVKVNNRKPKQSEINNRSDMPCSTTYQYAFDTIGAAVEEAADMFDLDLDETLSQDTVEFGSAEEIESDQASGGQSDYDNTFQADLEIASQTSVDTDASDGDESHASLETTESTKFAGYNVQSIPDHILFSRLAVLVQQNSAVPERDDIRDADYVPSVEVYEERFGSLRNAVERVGFELKDNEYTLSEAEVYRIDEVDDVGNVDTSDDEVMQMIDDIRMVGGVDTRPKGSEFDEHRNTASLYRAKQAFDGWSNAPNEAGYKPRRRNLSEDEWVGIMNFYIDQNGGLPEVADFDDCCYMGTRRAFNDVVGSLTDFARSGRIDGVVDYSSMDVSEYAVQKLGTGNVEWKRDEIIYLAARFMEREGRRVKVIDFKSDNDLPSAHSAYSHFDTIEQLVQEAGYPHLYEYNTTDDMYAYGEDHELTRNEAKNLFLRHINIAAGEYGPPTKSEFNDHDETGKAYQNSKFFDTWGDACVAAGFRREDVNSVYPRQYLIDGLADFVEQIGHQPDRYDIADCSDLPSGRVYQDRFGTIENAMREAGCAEYIGIASREEIVEHLKRIGGEDHIPSISEFEKDEKAPSKSAIYEKFDDMYDALDAAGYNDNSNLKYTTQEMLDSLKRCIIEHSGIPTQKEMYDNYEYMPNISLYYDRFGGGMQQVVEDQLGLELVLSSDGKRKFDLKEGEADKLEMPERFRQDSQDEELTEIAVDPGRDMDTHVNMDLSVSDGDESGSYESRSEEDLDTDEQIGDGSERESSDGPINRLTSYLKASVFGTRD
jgi:hypothetical protein